MSTFSCEKCKKICYDTNRGYITGCEHYPPDVEAVNYLFKKYLETRSTLKELWEIDGFVPDELIKRVEKLLVDWPIG